MKTRVRLSIHRVAFGVSGDRTANVAHRTPNIALKIAPCGRLDAPQAARHLVQR